MAWLSPDTPARRLRQLARNHSFVDGNQRAALTTALVFLWLNGFRVDAADDAITELVVGVVGGTVASPGAAVLLQRHAEARVLR